MLHFFFLSEQLRGVFGHQQPKWLGLFRVLMEMGKRLPVASLLFMLSSRAISPALVVYQWRDKQRKTNLFLQRTQKLVLIPSLIDRVSAYLQPLLSGEKHVKVTVSRNSGRHSTCMSTHHCGRIQFHKLAYASVGPFCLNQSKNPQKDLLFLRPGCRGPK